MLLFGIGWQKFKVHKNRFLINLFIIIIVRTYLSFTAHNTGSNNLFIITHIQGRHYYSHSTCKE